MSNLDTASVIKIASSHLYDLKGHVFDLLTVEKPISADAAVNLSKVISKLSPLLGNLIEFNTVEYLNDQHEFEGAGIWARQDPGFPDTVFRGVNPLPGFEIKAELICFGSKFLFRPGKKTISPPYLLKVFGQTYHEHCASKI